MEDYFLNCHSDESITTRFRSLAKKMHPDIAGNTPEANEAFRYLQLQRDEAFKKVHKNLSSQDLHKALGDFVGQFDNFSAYLENVKNMNFTDIGKGALSEWGKNNPGKDPSYGDMFKLVLGKMIKKPPLDKKHQDPEKLT
jgi:DnaJ-class molecular chaperone